jgi:hypothetical protein
VLDQYAVLEDGDLGTVSLLADHHRPVHRFAAGQELRLRQDRRAGTALVAAVPAALALGLQPGRAGDALHLVAGGPGRAYPHHGEYAVLAALPAVSGGATAAAATATTREWLAALRLLGVLGLGVGGDRLVLVGLVVLATRTLTPPATTPAAPAAAPAGDAVVVLVLVLLAGRGGCLGQLLGHVVDRLGGGAAPAGAPAATGPGRLAALLLRLVGGGLGDERRRGGAGPGAYRRDRFGRLGRHEQH